MTRAIVLLSGGIDSATCLALAADEHEIVQPIHYQYGQQTDDVEVQQAENLRSWAQEEFDAEVKWLEVIDYTSVFNHFPGGVSKGGKTFDHMNEDDGRSSGYVPMRNLHLIGTGAAVADAGDYDCVYHGAQEGDEADYPDCRPEFIDAIDKAIAASLPEDQWIGVKTPLLKKSKTEILYLAEELGVPFEYTYSCYEVTDSKNPEPCGSCPACVERAEAFEKAGLEDPFETKNEA